MANKLVMSLSITLPILYAGILLGISFLATPIKFLVPSLTLPVALDIGMVTFHALIKLEWFLVFLHLIILWFNPLSKLVYTFVFIIIITLAAQTFLVIPTLDTRIILIQQGEFLKTSYCHLMYIASDIIKVISLIGISYSSLGVLTAPSS